MCRTFSTNLNLHPRNLKLRFPVFPLFARYRRIGSSVPGASALVYDESGRIVLISERDAMSGVNRMSLP